MTLLGRGSLRVRRADQVSEFTVAGGFLQVVGDRVRIVAEHVQGSGA
jgi:F0F1-type ATP synthase epsilon subunit